MDRPNLEFEELSSSSAFLFFCAQNKKRSLFVFRSHVSKGQKWPLEAVGEPRSERPSRTGLLLLEAPEGKH